MKDMILKNIKSLQIMSTNVTRKKLEKFYCENSNISKLKSVLELTPTETKTWNDFLSGEKMTTDFSWG